MVTHIQVTLWLYLIGEVGQFGAGEQVCYELAHVLDSQGRDMRVRVTGCADQVRRHGRPEATPDEPDTPQIMVRTLHHPAQGIDPAQGLSHVKFGGLQMSPDVCNAGAW